MADIADANETFRAAENSYLTFGDFLEVIRIHRRAALITFATTAILVAGVLLMRTPLYSASSSLALDRARQPVDFNSKEVFNGLTGVYEYDLLNTQRDILLSRAVLRPVLESSSLMQNPYYRDALDPMARLRSRLNVSTSRDTWTLIVDLEDEDRARAEDALQAVIDSFLAVQSKRDNDRGGEAIVFLQRQADDMQAKLERQRQDVQQFQERNGIFINDSDKSYPAQRLTALNSKKVIVSEQLGAIRTLVKQILEADAKEDREERTAQLLSLEFINRHPTVNEQQRILYDLLARRVALSQKYLNRHPRMLEIDNEISAKRGQLEQAISIVRASILGDRDKLEGSMDNVLRSISTEETNLNEYRANVLKLSEMNDQIRSAQQIYDQLLKRLEEERVSAHLNVQQMRLLDLPTSSTIPINKKLTLTLLMSVIAGAISGTLVPMLLQLMDMKVRGRRDIREFLEIRVLAQIPVMPMDAMTHSNDPVASSALNEAFGALRTMLRLSLPASGCQRILVTSYNQHEGKSTVSANLAICLAASGFRTLIVDGDMRAPSIHLHLDQSCPSGLKQLLLGEPEMQPQPTRYLNLDMLDSGGIAGNAGELLNSHCLGEWLQHCEQYYDYVIIDSPALIAASDGLIIGSHCNGILVVVRNNVTQKPDLSAVKEALTPLKNTFTGVVLISGAEAKPYGDTRQELFTSSQSRIAG